MRNILLTLSPKNFSIVLAEKKNIYKKVSFLPLKWQICEGFFLLKTMKLSFQNQSALSIATLNNGIWTWSLRLEKKAAVIYVYVIYLQFYFSH